MGRRLKRKRARRRKQRAISRAAHRVLELFSSKPPEQDLGLDYGLEGGLGVREPRRPFRPTLSGAVALELPTSEQTHVRVVGEQG